jgi:hypothetical protein
VSLELRTSPEGKIARLNLRPPRRSPPRRIVLHLDHWSGRTGILDLPVGRMVRKTIRLTPGTGR